MFKIPVPSSLSTDDITLHPHPSKRLSFTPDCRNDLIIQAEADFFERYWLQEIQLLDEAGHPYDPRPSEALDPSHASSTSKHPIPSFSKNEISHLPVSLPAQHAESEMDRTSEGTEETGSVEVEAEMSGVNANSRMSYASVIEEERR